MAVRTFVEHQHILLQTALSHVTAESDLKPVSNAVNFARNKLAEKCPVLLKPGRKAFCSRILACRPKSDAAEQIRYP